MLPYSVGFTLQLPAPEGEGSKKYRDFVSAVRFLLSFHVLEIRLHRREKERGREAADSLVPSLPSSETPSAPFFPPFAAAANDF